MTSTPPEPQGSARYVVVLGLVVCVGALWARFGRESSHAPGTTGRRFPAMPLDRTVPAPSDVAEGAGGSRMPPLTPEQILAEEKELEHRLKLEAARRRTDEMHADYNRQAHALLERFHDLVYDPSRHAGMVGASGTIEVDADGKRGTYRFAFDASVKDVQKQVTTETVRQDKGIHSDAAQQAKRFAVMAARGAYSSVIVYDPPIEWYVSRAQDDHMIAVAPPHKSPVGFSYRFDLRGLVEHRGSTSGTRVTSRTVYEWTEHAGKWLPSKVVDDGGEAVTEYEFAPEKGIAALRRAALTEGTHKYVATLTWDRIETR